MEEFLKNNRIGKIKFKLQVGGLNLTSLIQRKIKKLNQSIKLI